MGASGSRVLSGVQTIYLGSAAQNGYMHTQASASAASGYDYNGTSNVNFTSYFDTKREVTDYGIKAIKNCSNITLLLNSNTGDTVTYSTFVDNVTAADRALTIPLDSVDGENVPLEIAIGYNRAYHKLKHRLSATLTDGIKVRGIINVGTLVNT